MADREDIRIVAGLSISGCVCMCVSNSLLLKSASPWCCLWLWIKCSLRRWPRCWIRGGAAAAGVEHCISFYCLSETKQHLSGHVQHQRGNKFIFIYQWCSSCQKACRIYAKELLLGLLVAKRLIKLSSLRHNKRVMGRHMQTSYHLFSVKHSSSFIWAVCGWLDQIWLTVKWQDKQKIADVI